MEIWNRDDEGFREELPNGYVVLDPDYVDHDNFSKADVLLAVADATSAVKLASDIPVGGMDGSNAIGGHEVTLSLLTSKRPFRYLYIVGPPNKNTLSICGVNFYASTDWWTTDDGAAGSGHQAGSGGTPALNYKLYEDCVIQPETTCEAPRLQASPGTEGGNLVGGLKTFHECLGFCADVAECSGMTYYTGKDVKQDNCGLHGGGDTDWRTSSSPAAGPSYRNIRIPKANLAAAQINTAEAAGSSNTAEKVLEYEIGMSTEYTAEDHLTCVFTQETSDGVSTLNWWRVEAKPDDSGAVNPLHISQLRLVNSEVVPASGWSTQGLNNGVIWLDPPMPEDVNEEEESDYAKIGLRLYSLLQNPKNFNLVEHRDYFKFGTIPANGHASLPISLDQGAMAAKQPVKRVYVTHGTSNEAKALQICGVQLFGPAETLDPLARVPLDLLGASQSSVAGGNTALHGPKKPLNYTLGDDTSSSCMKTEYSSATGEKPENGLNWWRVEFQDRKKHYVSRLHLFNQPATEGDAGLNGGTVWLDPPIQADESNPIFYADIGKELYALYKGGHMEEGKDYVKLGDVPAGSAGGKMLYLDQEALAQKQPVRRVYITGETDRDGATGAYRCPASDEACTDALRICGAHLYAPAKTITVLQRQLPPVPMATLLASWTRDDWVEHIQGITETRVTPNLLSAQQISTSHGGYKGRPLTYVSGASTKWKNRCSHTHGRSADNALPWWRVEFTDGRPHWTTKLKLWNRDGCCPERLNNAYVFLDPPLTSNNNHEIGKQLYETIQSIESVPGKASGTGPDNTQLTRDEDFWPLGNVASDGGRRRRRGGRRRGSGGTEIVLPQNLPKLPLKRIYVAQRLDVRRRGGGLTICGFHLWEKSVDQPVDESELHAEQIDTDKWNGKATNALAYPIGGSTKWKNQCTHTHGRKGEKLPWWSVEFTDGSTRFVSQVHLYNRDSCCPDRLHNSRVWLDPQLRADPADKQEVGKELWKLTKNTLMQEGRDYLQLGSVKGAKGGGTVLQLNRNVKKIYISQQLHVGRRWRRGGGLTICGFHMYTADPLYEEYGIWAPHVPPPRIGAMTTRMTPDCRETVKAQVSHYKNELEGGFLALRGKWSPADPPRPFVWQDTDPWVMYGQCEGQNKEQPVGTLPSGTSGQFVDPTRFEIGGDLVNGVTSSGHDGSGSEGDDPTYAPVNVLYRHMPNMLFDLGNHVDCNMGDSSCEQARCIKDGCSFCFRAAAAAGTATWWKAEFDSRHITGFVIFGRQIGSDVDANINSAVYKLSDNHSGTLPSPISVYGSWVPLERKISSIEISHSDGKSFVFCGFWLFEQSTAAPSVGSFVHPYLQMEASSSGNWEDKELPYVPEMPLARKFPNELVNVNPSANRCTRRRGHGRRRRRSKECRFRCRADYRANKQAPDSEPYERLYQTAPWSYDGQYCDYCWWANKESDDNNFWWKVEFTERHISGFVMFRRDIDRGGGSDELAQGASYTISGPSITASDGTNSITVGTLPSFLSPYGTWVSLREYVDQKISAVTLSKTGGAWGFCGFHLFEAVGEVGPQEAAFSRLTTTLITTPFDGEPQTCADRCRSTVGCTSFSVFKGKANEDGVVPETESVYRHPDSIESLFAQDSVENLEQMQRTCCMLWSNRYPVSDRVLNRSPGPLANTRTWNWQFFVLQPAPGTAQTQVPAGHHAVNREKGFQIVTAERAGIVYANNVDDPTLSSVAYGSIATNRYIDGHAAARKNGCWTDLEMPGKQDQHGPVGIWCSRQLGGSHRTCETGPDDSASCDQDLSSSKAVFYFMGLRSLPDAHHLRVAARVRGRPPSDVPGSEYYNPEENDDSEFLWVKVEGARAPPNWRTVSRNAFTENGAASAQHAAETATYGLGYVSTTFDLVDAGNPTAGNGRIYELALVPGQDGVVVQRVFLDVVRASKAYVQRAQLRDTTNWIDADWNYDSCQSGKQTEEHKKDKRTTKLPVLCCGDEDYIRGPGYAPAVSTVNFYTKTDGKKVDCVAPPHPLTGRVFDTCQADGQGGLFTFAEAVKICQHLNNRRLCSSDELEKSNEGAKANSGENLCEKSGSQCDNACIWTGTHIEDADQTYSDVDETYGGGAVFLRSGAVPRCHDPGTNKSCGPQLQQCLVMCGGSKGTCTGCDAADGSATGACCKADDLDDPPECKQIPLSHFQRDGHGELLGYHHCVLNTGGDAPGSLQAAQLGPHDRMGPRQMECPHSCNTYDDVAKEYTKEGWCQGCNSKEPNEETGNPYYGACCKINDPNSSKGECKSAPAERFFGASEDYAVCVIPRQLLHPGSPDASTITTVTTSAPLLLLQEDQERQQMQKVAAEDHRRMAHRDRSGAMLSTRKSALSVSSSTSLAVFSRDTTSARAAGRSVELQQRRNSASAASRSTSGAAATSARTLVHRTTATREGRSMSRFAPQPTGIIGRFIDPTDASGGKTFAVKAKSTWQLKGLTYSSSGDIVNTGGKTCQWHNRRRWWNRRRRRTGKGWWQWKACWEYYPDWPLKRKFPNEFTGLGLQTGEACCNQGFESYWGNPGYCDQCWFSSFEKSAQWWEIAFRDGNPRNVTGFVIFVRACRSGDGIETSVQLSDVYLNGDETDSSPAFKLAADISAYGTWHPIPRDKKEVTKIRIVKDDPDLKAYNDRRRHRRRGLTGRNGLSMAGFWLFEEVASYTPPLAEEHFDKVVPVCSNCGPRQHECTDVCPDRGYCSHCDAIDYRHRGACCMKNVRTDGAACNKVPPEAFNPSLTAEAVDEAPYYECVIVPNSYVRVGEGVCVPPAGGYAPWPVATFAVDVDEKADFVAGHCVALCDSFPKCVGFEKYIVTDGNTVGEHIFSAGATCTLIGIEIDSDVGPNVVGPHSDHQVEDPYHQGTEYYLLDRRVKNDEEGGDPQDRPYNEVSGSFTGGIIDMECYRDDSRHGHHEEGVTIDTASTAASQST
ncbi:unnamed protein product [Amoebophrya sp. A120]|nr:unnamed protein product [Amoebophrya sp. A120]|eukprot:GSA120T00016317001.1